MKNFFEHNDFFGLNYEDITDEQKNKLNWEGLSIFCEHEDIQKILSQKIINYKIDDIFVQNIYYLIIKAAKYDIICDALNKKAAQNDELLKKLYNYYLRNSFKLSNDNFKKYIKQNLKDNTLNLYTIDRPGSLEYIGDILDNEVLKLLEKSIKVKTNNYTAKDYLYPIVCFFINNLDEENFKRVSKDILAVKGSVYEKALISSIHVDDETFYNILKKNKDSSYKIYISKAISKDMLKRFAPISRLDVVERVVLNSISHNKNRKIFKDVSPEELKDLLFSSFMKYTKRVEKVMLVYTNKVELQNEQ